MTEMRMEGVKNGIFFWVLVGVLFCVLFVFWVLVFVLDEGLN